MATVKATVTPLVIAIVIAIVTTVGIVQDSQHLVCVGGGGDGW